MAPALNAATADADVENAGPPDTPFQHHYFYRNFLDFAQLNLSIKLKKDNYSVCFL